ncbi:diazepam binding inhibitor-like protein [Peziza echinospora]|nr:diazepam binding inhibitor-like protein [Peziza echinospora]
MPSAAFEAAAADVKNLKSKPTDEQLLELYGLYKQATAGDNDTTRPGTFDFKGKYKWDAWTALKGTSEADAEQKYIDLVNKLKEEHGF